MCNFSTKAEDNRQYVQNISFFKMIRNTVFNVISKKMKVYEKGLKLAGKMV